MSEILPTSKFDLKMQCIAIARGNVEEATKLYEFFVGDINIPDVTPPSPTAIQQIKDTTGSLFGWIKENRDDIAEAYNFVQSVRKGMPIVNSEVSEAAGMASPLPPIPPSPPVSQ